MTTAGFTDGNCVRVLRDGRETLPAMFAAIRGAQRCLYLEYYVVEDIHSEGASLFDLLAQKCAAGVRVAMIFDALGSSDTPARSFQALRQRGVQALPFNPPVPGRRAVRGSLNHRDHRKLLIADGRVAFVGGINLSSVYESQAERAPSGPRRWRDTDLQLEGPAVAQLQRLFLEHWTQHGGGPLQPLEVSAQSDRTGDETVGIIASTPSGGASQYYGELLKALHGAEQRIWITAGYFAPTAAEQGALATAAHRAVDVRLLLPAHNDSIASLAVQRSHYDALLEVGVKIFERNSVVLHSKSIVIDRSWSVVGSSNLDHRSVLFNDEVDAIVIGTQTAEKLSQLFIDDLSRARAIDAVAWHSRPLSQKLSEAFWRVWQRLL